MSYQPSWVILSQCYLCKKKKKKKKPWWYSYLGGDKRFHVFLNGINPKVNIIVRLEFELVSYDVAVEHISHYVTGTPNFKRYAGITFAFSLYLVLHGVLLVFHTTAPHTQLPKLQFVWLSYQMLGTLWLQKCSNSHDWNPEKHYLPLALDVGFRVRYELWLHFYEYKSISRLTGKLMICPDVEADGINLLLAFDACGHCPTKADLRLKGSGFGWATFGWAICILVT